MMEVRILRLTSHSTKLSKSFPIAVAVKEDEVNNEVNICGGLHHNHTPHPILKTTGSFEILTLKILRADNNEVISSSDKTDKMV